jgi:hypothetical protein
MNQLIDGSYTEITDAETAMQQAQELMLNGKLKALFLGDKEELEMIRGERLEEKKKSDEVKELKKRVAMLESKDKGLLYIPNQKEVDGFLSMHKRNKM